VVQLKTIYLKFEIGALMKLSGAYRHLRQAQNVYSTLGRHNNDETTDRKNITN